MTLDPLTLWPLCLVAAAALALRPELRRHAAVRALVVAGVAAAFCHYMTWRLFTTVPPADRLDVESAYIWLVFAIEAFGWFDAFLVLTIFLRRRDNRAAADAHEARLRAADPDTLPEVDVFIATYNEPKDVLERTIVGALALDWPRHKLHVWVLDDGRRDWLRAYAAAKGAGYLTRPDNRDAKAGNINAAIARTTAPYFMVLDADFVPKRSFLMRTMGFFADLRIGIVQVPHNFFNNDPMQANLGLRGKLPDDQRLFFDAIMPARDGWDCAFCCGSNSVTRRSAIEAIGARLPSGSITEDMLLTLALLRRGYVTRYLNEKLAIGLAPESLEAFFVQRARWAQGALQILYLKEGPLGPGLGLVQRLIFLPTHWLSQALTVAMAVLIPPILMLTGLMPLIGASVDAVIFYQLPAFAAVIAAMRFFAPQGYFPLTSLALSLLQSFRFLPMLAKTLVRPHGHAFRITPKGADARGGGHDRFTVRLCFTILALHAIGFFLTQDIDLRLFDDFDLFPIVAFWTTLNILVLLVALGTAFSAPIRRTQERFPVREAVRLWTAEPARARAAELRDLSLSGARVALPPDDPGRPALAVGDWIALEIAHVGAVPAEIVRIDGEADGRWLRLGFVLPDGRRRDALIRKLFTGRLDNAVESEDGIAVTLAILRSIFRRRVEASEAPPAEIPAAVPDAVRRLARRLTPRGTLGLAIAAAAPAPVAGPPPAVRPDLAEAM
ncbi:MAG: glycosyltransferase [Rhodospirillales bacterium]